MTTLSNRSLAVSALLWIAAALHAGGRALRTRAKHLHAWIKRRDLDAKSRRALHAMSDRQLYDIGLTRLDVAAPPWVSRERFAYPNDGLLRTIGPHDRAERLALLRSSCWLHAGLIGAALCAAGIVRLAQGDALAASTFAMVVLGGFAAVASWRRARRALQIDP